MGAPERPESLSRVVFDEIRARILDGRLRAGEPLPERDISAELDVSRVPIREALPLLEAAGLVKLSKRRPAVVTFVTRSGVDELYDIRSALEPLIAKKAAAAVVRGADASVLMGALERAGVALDGGDLDAFHYSSGQVHKGIEALAGNTLYVTITEPLRERSERLNVANMERDPAKRHGEHVALVEAIAQADVELAAAVAYSHVEWGRARTFETLSSVPGYDPNQ
ncbi:GntR family transcriptional regulator [Rhodococcus sp. KBS0724]|uniref:GntR family transcriptional regulator n=1 Tax=Rhodococcus sp. KBS0724 TaxID=1179674 RepID=UPI00110EDD7D|nr:GntR family transcriptional regulator [Rhodococcus sp. KBS0724]TSD48870.1 GntR family transcriptional regulator [Rhodococcus sp. KBS0724]